MIYDIYIIRHLYNPASSQHQAHHQHIIRHSMYIRYSFINTSSLMLPINALSLHRKIFRWGLSLGRVKYLLAELIVAASSRAGTSRQVDTNHFGCLLSLCIKNRFPGFVAVTGIAWSGFPENQFTSGGPFLLLH